MKNWVIFAKTRENFGERGRISSVPLKCNLCSFRHSFQPYFRMVTGISAGNPQNPEAAAKTVILKRKVRY